ncbi:preprotein translocase subunit SecE [Candidatus Uhrbacteria bacterium]|nr:preprotein translocase subunit SecE [Candidatus Uhrbacteria bacterium]
MFNKLVNYFKESKTELKKVTWPTRREAANHTLLVIGISLGVAIFFGVLDYLLALGVEKLITR